MKYLGLWFTGLRTFFFFEKFVKPSSPTLPTYLVCAPLLWLVVEEHLLRTQEKLERDCLEHHWELSLRLCYWLSTQVSLSLLTGEAGIMNVQGCGMRWYLS